MYSMLCVNYSILINEQRHMGHLDSGMVEYNAMVAWNGKLNNFT